MSCFNGRPCSCNTTSSSERPPTVSDLIPTYTSDVFSGHIQALNGRSFQGQSEMVALSSSDSTDPDTLAYIFLNNPKCSRTLIAVNNLTLVNYTGGVVQYQTRLTTLPTLATQPSNNVENTNCTCSFITPNAQIISLSTTTALTLDAATFTNLIPALSSVETRLGGSTIIGPGCCLAISATALSDTTGSILVNFRWFELAIKETR